MARIITQHAYLLLWQQGFLLFHTGIANLSPMKTLHLSRPCILCDDACQSAHCLCDACLKELPYLSSACASCGLPIETSTHSDICGACLASPPLRLKPDQQQGKCISVLHYDSPVDYLIKRMKYHNQLSIAQLLGQLIANKIKQTAYPLPSEIIPVPLHTRRLQQRGYNQAAEIAKAITQVLDIPLNLHICKRVKSTTPQFDLPASERVSNIKNAFALSTQLQSKHLALVDDVMTTGSTVWELASTLLQAGAIQVDIWVCARASTN